MQNSPKLAHRNHSIKLMHSSYKEIVPTTMYVHVCKSLASTAYAMKDFIRTFSSKAKSIQRLAYKYGIQISA